MGRRTKPTAIKQLAGNPGKRALPKAEPRPEGGIQNCPKHLDAVARAEWKRLSPQLDKLGLLTQVDRAAFTAYCELYSNYREASRGLKKAGGLTFVVNGQIKKNPLVSMRNDALRLMHKFLSEFGLSPSSRAKVASQMARDNPSQPTLPGMPPPAVDPNKPQMPTGPLTDDEFFEGVRH